MTDTRYPDWYTALEEGVRDLIFYLRNRGINTTCSCHHEWYIQVDCQAEDLRMMWSYLSEYGLRPEEFRFAYHWDHVHRYLHIMLDVGDGRRMRELAEEAR